MREVLGLIPNQGRNFRQVFFILIAYVDPALIGYLDVRRLESHIFGKWRRRGVMDNDSCVRGSTQALVIIHYPHISTASEQVVGV